MDLVVQRGHQSCGQRRAVCGAFCRAILNRDFEDSGRPCFDVHVLHPAGVIFAREIFADDITLIMLQAASLTTQEVLATRFFHDMRFTLMLLSSILLFDLDNQTNCSAKTMSTPLNLAMRRDEAASSPHIFCEVFDTQERPPACQNGFLNSLQQCARSARFPSAGLSDTQLSGGTGHGAEQVA